MVQYVRICVWRGEFMEISRRKRKMFSLLVTVAVLIAAFAFAPAVREAAAQVIGYGFSPEPEDDGNPDCGKDPSRWNPIGGHYERRYNKSVSNSQAIPTRVCATICGTTSAPESDPNV
jgi:hypothetical protein